MMNPYHENGEKYNEYEEEYCEDEYEGEYCEDDEEYCEDEYEDEYCEDEDEDEYCEDEDEDEYCEDEYEGEYCEDDEEYCEDEYEDEYCEDEDEDEYCEDEDEDEYCEDEDEGEYCEDENEEYDHGLNMDAVTQQMNTLSLKHCRDEKNRKQMYDQSYFPWSTQVKLYVNRSPNRSFWVRHPREIQLNWNNIVLIPGSKQFNKVVLPLKIPNVSEIRVYKIWNKYLERQYELKKIQKMNETQDKCVEYTMYHFTTHANTDKIIKNNFNWRLSGLSRGHKYGYGISFSPNSRFAEQFCKNKGEKVMFVVRVLVTTVQIGKDNMKLPDVGYDTTMSPKKTVYVKFEDSEFLPEYLVYYS